MKKLALLALLVVGLVSSIIAQSPQGVTFQAVARDPRGNAAKLRQIYVVDKVVSSTPTGTTVWEESHTLSTNAEGVFTIVIGRGTRVSGTALNFSDVDWSSGSFYFNLKVAVAPTLPDPSWTSTANYQDMGTTQLWSVPYAFYSTRSGSSTFMAGNNDPAASIGQNGDFYLNTNSYVLFGPKTTGVWGTGRSLVGPTGPQGPQGAAGAQGPQGPAGPQGVAGAQGPAGVDGKTVLNGTADPIASLGANGDFYINTATNKIFGPKTSGSWGAATSLVGPTGAQGLQGPAGAAGPQGAAGAQGPAGPAGADGAQGPIGPQGPAGSTLPNGSVAGNTTYWNGTTWVVNNSNIFNNGGYVGIGTTSPSSKLTVQGTGTTSATSSLMLKNSAGDTAMLVRNDGKVSIGNVPYTNSYLRKLNVGGDISFYSNDGAYGGFITSTDTTVHISSALASDLLLQYYSAGSVGVGTLSPKSKLHVNGNVAIGPSDMIPATGYKLSIAGKVICEEARVQARASWPDYVFEPTYKLISLHELESILKKQKHLPNIPSAKEVAKEGFDIGSMNAKLLEKVEELTLYLIELEKANQSLTERVKALETKTNN